jgi:hypothetical protein
MMSKWIPNRKEKYDEMNHKHAALDAKSVAETDKFSSSEQSFIKIVTVRPEFGSKNFFFVVLKKPVPVLEFSRIIRKVEEDLVEVARKAEEEEKARRS